MDFLASLVDASKLAGWARAGVAALLGALIAKLPWLANYLNPTTQAAIGTALAGIVVGVWSQWAKSSTANVAKLADSDPGVQKVVLKDKALADSIPSPTIVGPDSQK